MAPGSQQANINKNMKIRAFMLLRVPGCFDDHKWVRNLEQQIDHKHEFSAMCVFVSLAWLRLGPSLGGQMQISGNARSQFVEHPEDMRPSPFLVIFESTLRTCVPHRFFAIFASTLSTCVPHRFLYFLRAP
jgi:hypothetical protein